jgi:hypothetical protein
VDDLDDNTFTYTPPPDPPPLPRTRAGSLSAKIAIAAGLLLGAGFGGFAIAQAASSVPTSPAPYASSNMANSDNAADQSNNQGALQAASTPTATPAPKHSCPNMGSHSSSRGSASTTTSLTAY